jgi:hypothetical protein
MTDIFSLLSDERLLAALATVLTQSSTSTLEASSAPSSAAFSTYLSSSSMSSSSFLSSSASNAGSGLNLHVNAPEHYFTAELNERKPQETHSTSSVSSSFSSSAFTSPDLRLSANPTSASIAEKESDMSMAGDEG